MNRALALRLANVLVEQCCIEGIRSKTGRFVDNFKSDDALISRIADLILEICEDDILERAMADNNISAEGRG